MSAARQNHNVPGDTSGIQTINNEIQIIELFKRSALTSLSQNLSVVVVDKICLLTPTPIENMIHLNSANRK